MKNSIQRQMTAIAAASLVFLAILGSVSRGFAQEETPAQNEDSELESSMERHIQEPLPATSLVLRRHTDSIFKKYDTDGDGRLEEYEWQKMPGNPQSIDMDGDFVLDINEILFYLARYAKDRTIFHPVPKYSFSRTRPVRSDDRTVLIQPLSARMKVTGEKESEGDEEETELADLSEAEMNALVKDSNAAVGDKIDPELFGLLLDEMDESKLREFSAPRHLLQGLPVWFLARDLNGDGQLTLREFAPGLSVDATAFFGKLDRNSDGLLTPEEVREYLEKGLPKEEPTNQKNAGRGNRKR